MASDFSKTQVTNTLTEAYEQIARDWNAYHRGLGKIGCTWDSTWKKVHRDKKSSTHTFNAWAIDSSDGLKVKLEYKHVKLFEEKVTKVPFKDDYKGEEKCFEELSKIKPEKRKNEERLEIERLRESL